MKLRDSNAQYSSIPVIDTFIHLWDRTRPQGAPYPPKTLYGVPTKEQVLPGVFKKEMAPDGVVGAIAVEASPWVEDNLWLLETCAADTFMVGVVGNLQPNAKEFPEYIERYHRNPLFRGIRYGNIWGYDIVQQSANSSFLSGLNLMADAGLVLDVSNPQLDLLRATLRISDAVPNLKIVVDHLAGFVPAAKDAVGYSAVLRDFKQRPQTFGRISAFWISTPGVPVSTKLEDHRTRLDQVIESFGEDRVLAGGYTARGEPDLAIMREYYSSKPQLAAEKFFWQNSVYVYNWVRRAPDQPSVT